MISIWYCVIYLFSIICNIIFLCLVPVSFLCDITCLWYLYLVPSVFSTWTRYVCVTISWTWLWFDGAAAYDAIISAVQLGKGMGAWPIRSGFRLMMNTITCACARVFVCVSVCVCVSSHTPTAYSLSFIRSFYRRSRHQLFVCKFESFYNVTSEILSNSSFVLGLGVDLAITRNLT